MQQETVNVFIAYAREDAAIKERLKKNLKAIFRTNQADSLWDDGEINAGDDWQKAIGKALEQADIFLLLLSPDFIASDFCYETEMQKALEKHQKEEAIVIPLQIRACSWQNSPLKDLQILPEDGKAIHRSNEQHILDELYLQITERINQISNTVKEQKRIKKLKEQFDNAIKQANAEYKNQDWIQALVYYTLGMELYKEDFYPSKNEIEIKIQRCQNNIHYKDSFEKAIIEYKKENFRSALKLIEDAIAVKPTSNAKKAKELITRMLCKEYFFKAEELYEKKKWESAERAYTNVLKYFTPETELNEEYIEEKLKNSFYYAYPQPFEENDKWGYVNWDGKIILPAEFDVAEEFENGFGYASKDYLAYKVYPNGKLERTNPRLLTFAKLLDKTFRRLKDDYDYNKDLE